MAVGEAGVGAEAEGTPAARSETIRSRSSDRPRFSFRLFDRGAYNLPMVVFPLLVATVLAGAPQVRLAAPGFNHVGVDERLAELFSDHLAQQLVVHGVAVVTRGDIGHLLSLER